MRPAKREKSNSAFVFVFSPFPEETPTPNTAAGAGPRKPLTFGEALRQACEAARLRRETVTLAIGA